MALSEEAFARAEQKFPNDQIFQQLLLAAKGFQGTIIHDADGFKADYARFLNDILEVCRALRLNLPPAAFDERGLLREDEPYICILSLGYEFIIAHYAILALGGASVPLASGAIPEEAKYFIQKTKSNYLLVGASGRELAPKIEEYMRQSANQEIITIPIPRSKGLLHAKENIEIDEGIILSPSRPGFAVFTSGSTGPPKAVVSPRSYCYWEYNPGQKAATLSDRPPHWAGGAFNLLRSPMSGRTLYILPHRATPDIFWKSIRDNPITHLWVTPSILRKLKDYFQEHISRLPPEEVDGYTHAVRGLEDISSSSSVIAPSVLEYWKDLTGGEALIHNSFGSTEGGLISEAHPDSKSTHSIGTAVPGVSIKLTEGDHGEMLIKSAAVFTHYLNDEEATKAAFDEDGYFNTGDLAHRVGDEYIFDGRAKSDFISFNSYFIPIIELETSLTDLPYISEAFVIGAPDHEVKEVPAAIVRLKKPNQPIAAEETKTSTVGQDFTLKRIREDLLPTLAAYKLPVLLRILPDGEDVPRTHSDKVTKRGLLKQYFNISDSEFVSPDYSEPGVEYWGSKQEDSVQIKVSSEADKKAAVKFHSGEYGESTSPEKG